MCRDQQTTAIPHETLTVWQMPSTAPVYQAHSCTTFARSTIVLFPHNRPIWEAKSSSQVQSPSLKTAQALSLSSWMPHEDESSTRGALVTGSPLSHRKEGACLMMKGPHPSPGVCAHHLPMASLHLPCGKTWWKCRPALRHRSPCDGRSDLKAHTNAVLIIWQFHLFVCKYLIQTGNVSRIDALSFSRICMITRAMILVFPDPFTPQTAHCASNWWRIAQGNCSAAGLFANKMDWQKKVTCVFPSACFPASWFCFFLESESEQAH